MLKSTSVRDLLAARQNSQQSLDGEGGLGLDGDGGGAGGDGNGDGTFGGGGGGGQYTLASMISNDQSVRNRMSSQHNPRSVYGSDPEIPRPRRPTTKRQIIPLTFRNPPLIDLTLTLTLTVTLGGCRTRWRRTLACGRPCSSIS